MERLSNDFDINIQKIVLVMESFMSKRIYSKKWPRGTSCLVYVMEGVAEYHFEDKIVTAKEGDLVFLVQGNTYYFKVLSDVYHYIFIEFIAVEEDVKGKKNDIYTLKNRQMLRNAFEKLNTIWIYKKYAYRLECKSILYNVLHQVLRNDSSENILNDKYRKIKNAVEYMTHHYMDKEITISLVAGMLDLCEVHFRRLFKEVYSISPVKYLNILRIERAKDLLKVKGTPISEIAELVGYSSVYYFSSIFKKETDETPTQYRNRFF